MVIPDDGFVMLMRSSPKESNCLFRSSDILHLHSWFTGADLSVPPYARHPSSNEQSKLQTLSIFLNGLSTKETAIPFNIHSLALIIWIVYRRISASVVGMLCIYMPLPDSRRLSLSILVGKINILESHTTKDSLWQGTCIITFQYKHHIHHQRLTIPQR